MNESISGCLESYKLSSQFLKMNYSSKACLPNLAASFCTDSAYKFEMILVVRTCFLADKGVDFSHLVSALSEILYKALVQSRKSLPNWGSVTELCKKITCLVFVTKKSKQIFNTNKCNNFIFWLKNFWPGPHLAYPLVDLLKEKRCLESVVVLKLLQLARNIIWSMAPGQHTSGMTLQALKPEGTPRKQGRLGNWVCFNMWRLPIEAFIQYQRTVLQSYIFTRHCCLIVWKKRGNLGTWLPHFFVA